MGADGAHLVFQVSGVDINRGEDSFSVKQTLCQVIALAACTKSNRCQFHVDIVTM